MSFRASFPLLRGYRQDIAPCVVIRNKGGGKVCGKGEPVFTPPSAEQIALRRIPLPHLHGENIFFKGQSVFLDDRCVGLTHVADVPGLKADAGRVLSVYRIADDESVFVSELMTSGRFRPRSLLYHGFCSPSIEKTKTPLFFEERRLKHIDESFCRKRRSIPKDSGSSRRRRSAKRGRLPRRCGSAVPSM